MSRYEGLGRAIAERQDTERRASPRKAQVYRALFSRRAVPHRRPTWPIAVAVAAATVLVLVLAERWGSSPPRVAARTTYTARVNSPRELQFADGTGVTLKPGGRLRVETIDEDGATMRLEEGSLYAAVVKRGGRWHFQAGSYTVEVTGTAFDLSWTAPCLTLVMHEGSVRVTGPDTDEKVVAGERLVLPLPRPELAVVDPPKEPAPTASTPSAVSAAAAPSPLTSWEKAAAEGDHQAAYAAVEPRLDHELARLDEGAMLRLATVARLSGHPVAAGRIYRRLRTRFPGTAAAAEAAFALGSLSFGSEATEAEKWFRTALIEARGHGLAVSARGRLLELAQRRGDAEAVAEDYLRHHPDGPHAALAHQILDR